MQNILQKAGEFVITDIGEISLENLYLKMWEIKVGPEMKMLRDHRHINFEFTAVLDGSGIYHTTSGDKIMKKGDIFVFSSNEPHCITKIENEGLNLLNLHFNKMFLIENSLLDSEYPNIFFNHSKNFPSKISAEKSDFIFKNLSIIKNELSNKENGYIQAISLTLGLIFIDLLRNHSYYLPDENFPQNILSKIIKGVEYIDENFDKDITLEEIASKSGVTPNYFSKLFKDCFNVKLWDYITAKRIEKSKKLIIFSNDEKILDIALSCGFNNTANFNRAFRFHTGITPKEYKKFRNIKIS